jgi:cellulose 1,4-beta-cellobiosidase
VTVGTVTGTTFTDTGLTNGTTYYYVVVAVDGDERSGNSNQVSATPQLLAPTNLMATPQNLQVTLTWTAVSGANSYNVKRSTTPGGPYAVIANASGTTYTNTGLKNGTTYYYVVSAVEGPEQSANSNEVSATPLLLPPTNLTATAGNLQVKLQWDAVPGVAGYKVKRSTTAGGPYTTLTTVTTNSYTDTSVTNGKTYYYVVSAIDATTQSAHSNEASATPALQAPTGVTATAGNAQVALSWTASAGAISYKIRRSTIVGGPYSTIATATTTGYIDQAVKNGTTYHYVVAAYNGSQTSANSNPASATPSATLSAARVQAPPAPTNLTATAASRSIVLQWKGNAEARSYNVKRSWSSGGPYETIASTTSLNYTDTEAPAGTILYYIVTSVSDAESEPSNEVDVASAR